MLRGIHGTEKHKGKKPILEMPISTNAQTNNLDQLKIDLQNAIKSEDFEAAIELRDRIREVEAESS